MAQEKPRKDATRKRMDNSSEASKLGNEKGNLEGTRSKQLDSQKKGKLVGGGGPFRSEDKKKKPRGQYARNDGGSGVFACAG